ncbi:hypothetical protein GCM10022415_00360 [Knoellia locipacati]|uniref:Uncharacterized protein n=1 Tax=Knoellia locipacati TaxID=882824 RepID=A0A512SVM7_9MICO|nr:hypothetical protein [Knoellia locipacati]GEQ11989.1 hypothetical protein KLO01_00360 [Knoellia locipacati]
MTTLDTRGSAQLDAAVRRLDPASPTLTDAQQRRALDLRERILASGPDANVLGRPPQQPLPPAGGSRRRRRRLVVAGGLVGAATAGVLVAPLLGDEPREAAWSATPTAMSADDARELGESCLDTAQRAIERPGSPPAQGSFAPEQRRAMRVVLGERRGPYEAVVLGNAAGYDLDCLSVGSGVPVVSGGRYPMANPAVDGISLSGSAQSVEGADGAGAPGEMASTAFGRVGSQVTGVRLSTPAGPVTASVANGWFAAVWPGTDTIAKRDPFADVSVTLTLADGRTTGPTAYASFPQREVPGG